MAVLRRGSKGPKVQELQELLNKAGYDISVDGIFGNGSEWAVKDFQRKENLDVDGLAGPGMLSVLRQKVGTPAEEQPQKIPTLRKGDSGQSVIDLQAALAKHGYDLGSDGLFGWGTEAAIKDFQRKKNLAPDGVAGPVTWRFLKNVQNTKPTPVRATINSSTDNHAISKADIKAIALDLDVEPACIKAVYTVESRGKGFLSNGDPKILFEGHIFWRQLKLKGIDPEQYATANSDILYPKWTRSFYKGGIKEYDRLSRAKKIDLEAALASASWGTFQIMGFNFKACGFENVTLFVNAMYVSEAEHLKAFGSFIKSVGLLPSLKRKDWAAFAKGYNGPAYKQNQYDTKLAQAYQAAISEG